MKWTTNKRIVAIFPDSDGVLIMDWNDGTRRSFDIKQVAKNSLTPLLDQDYFKKAYVAGHGLTVCWPDGQDIAPEALYELSTIVGDQSIPLPPRDSCMRWDQTKHLLAVHPQNHGILVTDWDDGTCRVFDTWANASSNLIEQLTNPSYFERVRITNARNGIEWPNNQGFDAATLYEHAAIISE